MIVSNGNTKLGKIANCSILPVKDCVNCHYCKKDCYALKAYRMYPSVKKAWTENSVLLRSNMVEYFNQVNKYITKKQPAFFRIHVAGDFISRKHFTSWIKIAKQAPDTKFLAFTKSFKFIKTSDVLPNNFTVVLSVFKGMKHIKLFDSFPLAIAGSEYTGKLKKLADNSLQCPGTCDSCGMCWNLKNINRNVTFKMH